MEPRVWRASSLAMLAAFSPLLICVRQEGGPQLCQGPSYFMHSPFSHAWPAWPLSSLSVAPFPCLPSPSQSHPGPPARAMCLSGKGAAAGTFWATWLTQGEVQLLRSGPRGFQSPRAGRHWKEAIPAGTDRQEQERREGWAKAGKGAEREGEKWVRTEVRGTRKNRYEAARQPGSVILR